MINGWEEHMRDSWGAEEDSRRERFAGEEIRPEMDEPDGPICCDICGDQLDKTNSDIFECFALSSLDIDKQSTVQGFSHVITGYLCEDCSSRLYAVASAMKNQSGHDSVLYPFVKRSQCWENSRRCHYCGRVVGEKHDPDCVFRSF